MAPAFNIGPAEHSFVTNIAFPLNSPPIRVLQFISNFCLVVNGSASVICPVDVRLLSVSEFGSAPVERLISFQEKRSKTLSKPTQK